MKLFVVVAVERRPEDGVNLRTVMLLGLEKVIENVSVSSKHYLNGEYGKDF